MFCSLFSKINFQDRKKSLEKLILFLEKEVSCSNKISSSNRIKDTINTCMRICPRHKIIFQDIQSFFIQERYYQVNLRIIEMKRLIHNNQI
ncbi:hypothetical protein CF386_09250 [Paraphotobacterium marinum]|uniref:Uncharacterized protein n=1 Tax=Paraphotobacterium marinum TaxID=1755811 RepID=A0A220VFV8_9GAMM|nr:hypothetical protein [Paraphotobacterium marinum]ASK79247.1 hypothetical protein CF386_09250 [Paraphotobacterium marinum]